MIDTVIFDVDGTLAETEEVHRRAFNRTFAELGLAWGWDETLYRDLLRVTGGKERIAHYAALEGVALDPETIARIHARKTAIYTGMIETGEVGLRRGVPEFLFDAKARGLGLAIATTTTLANVSALLAATLGPGWRGLFPVVIAGDMVTQKKPAPDAYLLALAQLERAPEACVAVEDSRNGVRSALAAGLRVIAVRSAYCGEDDLSGASAHLPNCAGLTLELLARLDAPAAQRPERNHPAAAG